MKYILGALRNSVLGEFTRKDQTHSRLNFARGDGRTLVVGGEFGSFTGDTFKNVVDKRVHDGHGLVGDTGIGVDLLEDLVDVGCVGLTTGDLATLLSFLLFSSGLCGSLSCGLCLRERRESELRMSKRESKVSKQNVLFCHQ